MADTATRTALEPMRALRYDAGRFPLAEVVAPPYDVISPADRDALLRRSDHNVVRLELPDSAQEAARLLHSWRGDGAIRRDDDLNILFRIVMQCQIIDDVLDYSQDLSAGLPSFLTASTSLPQAFELTRLAALGYADDRDLPRTPKVFPLRSALFLVSTCTKLVIVLGRISHRQAGCAFSLDTTLVPAARNESAPTGRDLTTTGAVQRSPG